MQASTLSQQQLDTLLERIASAKERTMLLFSFFAGLRQSEIASLRPSDVINSNGEIRDTVRISGKSKEARTVPLHQRIIEALNKYIDDDVKQQQFLFMSNRGNAFSKVTINQAFRRIYDKAQLPDCTSHSGRRTFLTNLHNAGTPIKHMQVLAGHQFMTTTQRYIDSNPDQLRSAVDKL